MGKIKAPKKGAAASNGPYDRKTAGAGKPANTNIFRFDKDFGQHILKNPGIRLAWKTRRAFLSGEVLTGDVV